MSQYVGLVVRIPTKIVRCKSLAFNIGDCVSLMAQIPLTAVSPMYIGKAIPKHVKEPREPFDKSRVLISSITGQIPQLLTVKLHRHHYR